MEIQLIVSFPLVSKCVGGVCFIGEREQRTKTEYLFVALLRHYPLSFFFFSRTFFLHLDTHSCNYLIITFED